MCSLRGRVAQARDARSAATRTLAQDLHLFLPAGLLKAGAE